MLGVESKLDFLAIGDMAADLFMRLKDAHVHCRVDEIACELCLPFGGKVPYESTTLAYATGNGPNSAVCAARLGLSSALVSNIGSDAQGSRCLQALKKEKVSIKFIKKEKTETSIHYVLWYDIDRTILTKHVELNYSLPKIPAAKWMYLSSLGKNSLSYCQEILEYMQKHPDTKLAFQPGTMQIKMGRDSMEEIYKRTDIFFSNVEEAEEILEVKEKDALKLSMGIHALGPKIVVISDGKNGAYLYEKEELWHTPIFPDPNPPLERTGAGDAFSATFVSALILGKAPIEALAWGPVNSMSVIQKIGPQAGLLNRKELEKYLKEAPASYAPKKIN